VQLIILSYRGVEKWSVEDSDTVTLGKTVTSVNFV